MTTVIMVELPPAEASSPYVRSLLESCEVGTRWRAQCLLAPASGGADPKALVAIVSWDTLAHVRAELTVGVLVGGAPLWRTRVIEFAAADVEEERWRSVGFAIATLFGESLAGVGAMPSPPVDRAAAADAPLPRAEDPASTTPPSETAHQSEVRVVPRWWTDLRFSGGAGIPSISPALGGALGLSRMLDGTWFLDGSLAFSLLKLQPYQLSIVRPSVSIGGGAAIPMGGRFRSTLGAQATLQVIMVQGTDSTGRTDAGDRWVTGLRQSIDVEWSASDHVWLMIGGAATEVAGATDVQAQGRTLARVSSTDIAGEVGVRVGFP